MGGGWGFFFFSPQPKLNRAVCVFGTDRVLLITVYLCQCVCVYVCVYFPGEEPPRFHKHHLGIHSSRETTAPLTTYTARSCKHTHTHHTTHTLYPQLSSLGFYAESNLILSNQLVSPRDDDVHWREVIISIVFVSNLFLFVNLNLLFVCFYPLVFEISFASFVPFHCITLDLMSSLQGQTCHLVFAILVKSEVS